MGAVGDGDGAYDGRGVMNEGVGLGCALGISLMMTGEDEGTNVGTLTGKEDGTTCFVG